MSLRSAAAAALCAGLPAAALAQQPAPLPPPTVQVEWTRPADRPAVSVERSPGVRPVSAAVQAGPPAILPAIPPPESVSLPAVEPPAAPAPRPTPAAPAVPSPPPAALPAPRPAPAVTPATAEAPPKPVEPVVVEPDTRFTYEVNVAPAVCPDGGDPDGCAWGSFEWLYWAGSGQGLPPLVTVSPPGTPRALAGALGQPTTLTQFGGGRANNDFRDGFRFTGGWWSDAARTRGWEADFFFLSRSREGVATSSDGSAVIARPFFNAAAGVPDAEFVSFPGVVAGTVTADATSRVIGGGINRLHNLCKDPCGRVDLVVGFRYLHLADTVTVAESLTALDAASRVTPGASFVVSDRFATSNDFYGGVIGLSGERRYGAFFVGGKLSVALGGVVQTTSIDGRTTIGGIAQSGGLLALPSNAGSYRRTTFAVVPEVGVRTGFQVTERMRVYGAYNFLYLSDVARAGDQIDPAVNPALLPPRGALTGPVVPTFPGRTTDFWLQGVSTGVEFRF